MKITSRRLSYEQPPTKFNRHIGWHEVTLQRSGIIAASYWNGLNWSVAIPTTWRRSKEELRELARTRGDNSMIISNKPAEQAENQTFFKRLLHIWGQTS